MSFFFKPHRRNFTPKITQPHPHFFAGDSDALFRSGAAESYMRKCPDEDTCCFSLREYMAIDFWGRKSSLSLWLALWNSCLFLFLVCSFELILLWKFQFPAARLSYFLIET